MRMDSAEARTSGRKTRPCRKAPLKPKNGLNGPPASGYSYDAAGNLLTDGSCNPCWQYDDSGNLVSSAYGSSAASYSYDALGRRVEKVSGTTTYDFVLDGSSPLDEYQGSSWPTTWTRTTDGVFTYANGTTYLNRTDNLGTPRLSTDYTGTVKRTETMGPFGDGFTETYTGLDFAGFAGGVWDQENNGDHFGAREYAKTQGRWLTPDPSGLAAVDVTNPQTWNRYAYVTNNPVSMTDPLGLFVMGGGGEGDGGDDSGGPDPGAGCAGICTTGLFGLPLGTGLTWRLFFNPIIFNPINANLAFNGPAGVGPSVTTFPNGTNLADAGSSTVIPGGLLPNGDVAVGMNIFQNSAQCPNCGTIWRNANQISDPRTIALWYGAAAAPGAAYNIAEICPP